MRCITLFLTVALFASKPAAAQVSAVAEAPAAVSTPTGPAATLGSGAVVARPAAVPDTALALHRLFEVKRRRRNIIMGGTVGVGAAMVGGVLTNEASHPENSSQFGPNLGAAAIAVTFLVGVPALVIEGITLGGWGEEKEQLVLAAWQQHQLPKKYYHHLNAKHGKYFR